MKLFMYKTGDWESLDQAKQYGACHTIYVNDDADVDDIKHAVHQTAWMFGYTQSELNIVEEKAE